MPMTKAQEAAVKALEDEATLLRACRQDLPPDAYLEWCRSWLSRQAPLSRAIITADGFSNEDMQALAALVDWGPSVELFA